MGTCGERLTVLQFFPFVADLIPYTLVLVENCYVD